jgi:hypothetical protein
MARSVAELLPRPFAELTLDDVAAIVAATGTEERETLWFERKATVTPNSLSKACAAFANTYGGLLVVGVADEDDALVGIEPLAAEAQLWVKDTLRGLVLPMPPFRARWLPAADGRGVLLVLIEESSTTPHLLMRSGAIYVRNPGSSDPVPIGDQRRLLDLTACGERAIEQARNNARQAASEQPVYNPEWISEGWQPFETLALSATGVSADFETRIFDDRSAAAINAAVWGPLPTDARSNEQRWPLWDQEYVGVRRGWRPLMSFNNETVQEVATVDRSGTFRAARGSTTDAPDRLERLTVDGELRPWLTAALRAGRDLLTEYGAHGDLQLSYRLDLTTHGVWFESVQGANTFEPGRAIGVQFDWTFDDEDGAAVDRAVDRVFAELLRAVGHGPRNL